MIVIQSKDDFAGVPHPSIFDSACAMYAAQENLQDYQLVTYEKLKSGDLDNRITLPATSRISMFVGSVEFMREVWSRMGVSPDVPMNSDKPAEIWTMAQVREFVSQGSKIFVKPVNPKEHDMSGVVMSPDFPNQYANVPDDAELLAYPVFHGRIISEWRCYVHNGNIVYAANYSGDIFVSPDWDKVKSVVSKLKGFPCAFTADFAVVDDEWPGMFRPDRLSTEVVEFNDFWAIGNYGLDNNTYLRMLKDRYSEIVNRKSCWDVKKQ